MTLKIPNVGEFELLKSMLGGPAQDLILKLFVNNITPGDSDTTAMYTEMSTHGYVSKQMPLGGWTFSQLNQIAEATHTRHSWEFTAGPVVPVYGYYVVGAASGILCWAERITPVFSAEILGDSLSVTPKMTFSSY